jgi:ATP-binding cassette subfamily B protein
MQREEVPVRVQELLERQQLNGVPVLLAAVSDLSLPGEIHKQWVVVNRDHLTVVADSHEPRLAFHVPLAHVDQFRTRSTVGSGFLQAYVDDSWIDVARFSNKLAPQFHQFAERLEGLRANGAAPPAEPPLNTDHCPKCGLKLPETAGACPRCLPRRAIAARIWKLLRPQWRGALGMCLLMLASVCLELVPPKLQQYLVDGILAGGQAAPDAASLLTLLAGVVMALVGTRLILALVNWNKRLLANKVGVGLTFELRSQLVRKLNTQGLGYYDRHEVGSLVSRVVHDSEVMHSLVQQLTAGFLLQIIQVFAIGVMLFSLNPKLAAYTLIPAPLVFVGSLIFWKRVYPNYYRYWDAGNRQAGALSGMLSGVRVVKAFAQEDREFGRFHESSDRVRRSRVTVDRATASFSAIMGLVFSMGGLIVWYVGGRDVLGDQMTLGALMAFLAYLAMFYEPLSTLSEFTTWLTSVLTGCQRVFEVLDAPADTHESADPRPLSSPRGEVRFDKVTFGYERHRPVLKDIDVTIHPGERIGIVGKSGSGKSTLVNLISRFYDVDQGRVLFDGVNVRDLSQTELRSHVGVVLQEPHLFRGTICDNILYGRPTADVEQAIAAAHAAQAHDFILHKPLGYDTWLGERGAGLSGGEKQRISIARAVLCDPKVLILDEATSSIDTESEQAIQEALRALTHGRTTIAIAHRLSTLRDSDRIFVMDDGRLVEQGTHEELMRGNGHYARLVKLQTQVARNMQLESSLAEAAHDRTEDTSGSGPPAAPADAALCGPRWLEPGDAALREGGYGSLVVELATGGTHRGVSAACCFPASRPGDFISLRACDRDGAERELGVLRHLDKWPGNAQLLIRQELTRNYFLRRVTRIDSIRLDAGHLAVSVRTNEGPAQFMMRWNQSQAYDFGARGKVLVDVDDNRYLIEDLDALPPRDRDLLGRFIY